MGLKTSFTYLNHRGEEQVRTVDVDSVEFHFAPGFGYQPGWFISGFCTDRAARRSFALPRIILPPAEGFDHTPNRTFRLFATKGPHNG